MKAMNPIFNNPQILTRYSDGSMRVVCNDQITTDTRMQDGVDSEHRPIIKQVVSIQEERPSRGTFSGQRPTSYRLTLAIPQPIPQP